MSSFAVRINYGKKERNIMSLFEIDIPKIADTLMNSSTIFNCSLEEAWEKWMHPFLTKNTTFEEVKEYIDRKIALGDTV